MPNSSEIAAQVAYESERRTRLGVPAFAGGVLYLLSGIVISSTLNGAPSVGLLQGLGPALRGEANPSVSPRAAEVKFISHHTFPLIVGSVLAAIAIAALVLVLLFLLDATRFRRPETWLAARPLVLFGGIAVALLSPLPPEGLANQVVRAFETHNFAIGHDFSNHAVDQVFKGTASVLLQSLGLLAGLVLAAGVIAVILNAKRVGLLTRWMMILGIFMVVLAFTPFGLIFGFAKQLIAAFWLVAMGILLMGRWPNGDPPAWAAGEARPWPSQAEMRAERENQQPKRGAKAKPALSPAGADVAPAPAASVPRSSRKRRRKGR
jgi:hypothetical protein